MFFNIFEKLKAKEFRLSLFVSIFVGSVLMSNVMGGKISELNIFGLPFTFSVGIIPFFMTFFILDAINEVYGREKARETVWLALLVQAFVFVIILASVALPFAARSWVTQEQFDSVFSSSLRIIIASLIAFFLADMSDTVIFQKLREKTKGKMLWLRTNVSNFIGETIDTFVFMFLAFFEVGTNHDIGFVIALSLPYLALKLVLSVANTPFVYAAVSWLRAGGKIASTATGSKSRRRRK